jgi:hypothetical protein
MRIPTSEFQALGVEANLILADVPLRDVNVIDLPSGGAGRSIADIRALLAPGDLTHANPVVRALFGLRHWLGILFRWDRAETFPSSDSYVHRIDGEVRRRSLCEPGTRDGAFRLLYLLENESLAELRNATVHAFLASALRPTPTGYRLYWAVYVKPVSRLSGLYMALIEPFRRFIVYPAILQRVREAWERRYVV